MSYHANRTGCLGVGYKSQWESYRSTKKHLPVKNFVRTMLSITKALENLKKGIATINNNYSTPLIKVTRRNHFTVFFHEKTTDSSDNTPTGQNIIDAEFSEICNEKNKKTELIKQLVAPFKQEENQYINPYIPHPTVVLNKTLLFLADNKDIANHVIPPIVITHKIPNKATQKKNDFSVLASVKLSDDPIGPKKTQFAILTNRTRTLNDMMKCGYSDKLTQRFFASINETQNNTNSREILWLYAYFYAPLNAVEQQKKLQFFLSNVSMPMNMHISDLEIILYKNQKFLETLLSIKKKPLLIAGNVNSIGLSPIKKQAGEIKELSIEFNQINAKFNFFVKTPKKNTRAFPQEKPNVDTHLHRPRKKFYVKQKDGKFVKYKNNRYLSGEKKQIAQHTNNTNNNNQDIINNDDDIFS